MVNEQPITGGAPPQRPRIAELRAIFDDMPDRTLLRRLRAYRPVGRQGYSLRAMWRAYMASFHLNLPHTNALIRELEDDPALRAVCGFDPEVPLPDRRTFNRFIRRLADHPELVEDCLATITTELKTVLPDLGDEVAIDASVVRTHADPRRDTDAEASWGVSHSPHARNKDGTEWVYGYKLHMIADANHGLPIAAIFTTGSRSDSPELPPLIDHAMTQYDWFHPKVAVADRGYDSATNHQALWFGHGILPIIHIRKPSNTNLYQGIYTPDGVPTCLGMVPMEYRGTDEDGYRVYHCRRAGCELADSPSGGVRHCDTEYRQDPNEDIRLFGVIRRNSRRWRRYYRKRQAVERLFKSMKESRRLERHRTRGLRHVRLHALMSTLTFQITALMRIRTGDRANMRWMVRAVA